MYHVSSSRLDGACGSLTVIFNIKEIRFVGICWFARLETWMHIHMLSLQKQSGKTAVYITSTIPQRQWHMYILHYKKNECFAFCVHALACACLRVSLFVWRQINECVCVCLSMFFWSETAGSDCPVFPFPLWLITRVPVNPWYHHRIKRRPPSPREPISSESRTQTGKLLDIFAGPGMVKTSGLKDAPWHHPAAGGSPFCMQHTQVQQIKTMSGAPGTSYHDKRREHILHIMYVSGNRRKKVRVRDHVVMFRSACIFQLQWLHSS